jgi:hypothetical protein
MTRKPVELLPASRLSHPEKKENTPCPYYCTRAVFLTMASSLTTVREKGYFPVHTSLKTGGHCLVWKTGSEISCEGMRARDSGME